MSFGVASGQASAATSSLRFVTVTVRAAAAFEPPVVPRGMAGVATPAQPSSGARTSRAGSVAAPAARTAPTRKPMDNRYAKGRARLGKNIQIPRTIGGKRAGASCRSVHDTGFHAAGIPDELQEAPPRGSECGHKTRIRPDGWLLHSSGFRDRV